MLAKGQLGPQGLEDLPMTVMAFIVGVASLLILFGIVSDRLVDESRSDIHSTGKRLTEQLSGSAFQSDESSSYGEGILDGALITRIHTSNSTLSGLVGPVEYAFQAVITAGPGQWAFGSEPPKTSLAYGSAVTVLIDGILYNGEVTVKIWR